MEILQEDIVVSTFDTGTGFAVRRNVGVRVLHIPTNITVTSTEGRSAHANRDICFKLLKHWLKQFYITHPMTTKPTIEITQKQLVLDIVNRLEIMAVNTVYLPGPSDYARAATEIIAKYVEFGKGTITKNSRVRIIDGFSKGSKGTVDFIEPMNDAAAKVWVTRDGDSSPKFWLKHELEIIE